MRINGKLVLSIALFALYIAPTIISYQSYTFEWDDSDYLWRAISVSRSFWSGNKHELGIAMLGTPRPPVMTLLGLPWGPLASWDAAGKCFITLTAFTAFFAACCLFLLLRIGLKPLYLVIASVCVFAALGPYPAGADAHFWATAFMADSLFAWTAFAAVLLIPYEATTPTSSTTGALVRGIFWATVLLAGAMTKVSFFYFIALIVPALFAIRMRHSGLRSAFLALSSLAICSVPAAIYWLRYGLPALKNGLAASFGHDAPFYYIPLWQFLSDTVRQSPGMLLPGMLAIAAIMYLIVKRRYVAWRTILLSLLIMVGYCAICLASSNRQIRFLFPGIIAFPFLIGILISAKTYVVSRGHAVVAAIFVFCCLVAAGVPMLHRANRQSIAKSELVLAQAIESNAKHVLLATDSSTLNDCLMKVAIAVSPSRLPVESHTLSRHAAAGLPIEVDFQDIRESDLVVFQNNEALDSPRTNQRISEYEQYTRQHFGDVPSKVVDGIRIYGMSHNPQ